MNIEKIDKIKRKILPILKRYNAKRVDLGEYSTIKPIIKEQILSEEVSIL